MKVQTPSGPIRANWQTLRGRDRQPLKSRTFAQEHQATAWLERNNYKEETI